MFGLVEEPLDLMIVIGGFNSSNTSHLQEIAMNRGIPSYWIDGPARIRSGNRIQHKPLHGEIEIKENWLPDGKLLVGITSGASTPDKSVEEAIGKILELKATPALV
jgi:4-hydroxy-3-methylbut-2-enyl diphosphate reductase